MSYVTFNITEKIEMSQFKTEESARAYCRKGHSQYHIIFEGSFKDVDENKTLAPIAIYVKGKGFDCVPVKKDVPYTTYRVIHERLPNSVGFEFILAGDKTIGEVDDELELAFENGAKLVWVIQEDLRMIDAYNAGDRRQYLWFRDNDTIDGGDVQSGYSMKVADLFEEVVME
jgi:hypothetical protein